MRRKMANLNESEKGEKIMANTIEYANVNLTVDGAAAIVQFNCPHRKNAMSPFLREMRESL